MDLILSEEPSTYHNAHLELPLLGVGTVVDVLCGEVCFSLNFPLVFSHVGLLYFLLFWANPHVIAFTLEK